MLRSISPRLLLPAIPTLQLKYILNPSQTSLIETTSSTCINLPQAQSAHPYLQTPYALLNFNAPAFTNSTLFILAFTSRPLALNADFQVNSFCLKSLSAISTHSDDCVTYINNACMHAYIHTYMLTCTHASHYTLHSMLYQKKQKMK